MEFDATESVASQLWDMLHKKQAQTSRDSKGTVIFDNRQQQSLRMSAARKAMQRFLARIFMMLAFDVATNFDIEGRDTEAFYWFNRSTEYYSRWVPLSEATLEETQWGGQLGGMSMCYYHGAGLGELGSMWEDGRGGIEQDLERAFWYVLVSSAFGVYAVLEEDSERLYLSGFIYRHVVSGIMQRQRIAMMGEVLLSLNGSKEKGSWKSWTGHGLSRCS